MRMRIVAQRCPPPRCPPCCPTVAVAEGHQVILTGRVLAPGQEATGLVLVGMRWRDANGNPPTHQGADEETVMVFFNALPALEAYVPDADLVLPLGAGITQVVVEPSLVQVLVETLRTERDAWHQEQAQAA